MRIKKIRSTVRIAVASLKVNKLRSILTMLGIIIGVGAVIAMVSVGQGADVQVEAQIAAMGSNLLIVQAGSKLAGVVHTGYGGTKTLTPEDEAAILEQVPSVKAASAGTVTRQQVIAGPNNWGTTIQGTEPAYFDIRNWRFDLGSGFTSREVRTATNVAVLGATPLTNLFPDGGSPIGKTIRIKNLPFTVVGTLMPKGQSSQGQDQDDYVYIPYTTLMKKLSGQDWLQNVSISAVSKEAIQPAIQQIANLLHARHRIRAGQADDFNISNLEELYQAQESSSRAMSILLAAVASVSLLVGGIGIMNIMLVSVTERTREIGLRLAVGAKTRDILMQFLIEAMMLSLFGGVVGISLGAATAVAVSHFAGWRTVLGLGATAASFFFAAVIGIAFGYYPARTAARLDPIEALRHE